MTQTQDTTYKVYITNRAGTRTDTGVIFRTKRLATNEARRWSWQHWVARVEVEAVEGMVAGVLPLARELGAAVANLNELLNYSPMGHKWSQEA